MEVKLCKCEHDVELHKHYTHHTKCSQRVDTDNFGRPIYCECPRGYRKFLWFWI